MKKVTLIAFASLAALSAGAQYTCDPTVETVIAKGKVSNVITLALDEAAAAKLEAQGAAIVSAAPNDDTNHLYVWDGTMDAGDSSYPGVGDQTDGYASFVVGSAGWSGAGYNCASINTEWWNADTRFHIAYMSSGVAPESLALIIADGKDASDESVVSAPAKVALGAAFSDNGATYPAIGPKASDDWQGIDISFADLKKFWPDFDWKALKSWSGNIMSFLGGGVTGNTFALDAIYFYQLGEGGGVEGVANDAQWVVTDNTVNVAGTNGIVLYNLNGQLVKETAGTTLGIDNLPAGLYVAKSGNAVRKLIVK